MDQNTRYSDKEFNKLLALIKKKKNDEAVREFINCLEKREDLSINAEADFGGPKVGLSIQTRKFTVNLLVDLRTKITISVLKRINNGKKNKEYKQANN